jgi:hypothetical protein
VTLTIPTCELVGAINDVAAMAWDDDTLPMLNVVRLELDDEYLHAMATDRYRIGWTRWTPDDPPEEPEQETLGTEWGWDDHGWGISLRLADAQHLVKVFSLPAKEGWTPLTVEHTLRQLTVRRSADTGHPAYTATYDAADGEFPDIQAMLARTSTLDDVQQVAFNARYLADFAKVRSFGPLEMYFSGRHRPCHVKIGERFTGAVMPVRIADDGPVDHLSVRSAAELVILTQHASKEMLTKRLKVPATRAASLLEALQQHGIIKAVGAGDWQVVEEDLDGTLADLDERLRANGDQP